jgi:hypothetical protein
MLPWNAVSTSSTLPKSTVRWPNEELVGEALAPFRNQVVIARSKRFCAQTKRGKANR